MTTRANYKTESSDLVEKYIEFNNSAKQGAIDETTRNLDAIRASRLNGCAFCLNTSCLRNTSALLPDRFYVSHTGQSL
jgi:alkylhydroperoxidase family enzyme